MLNSLFQRYPRLAPLEKTIGEAVECICDSFRKGGKVLVCGNGGSACDSEHIVAELMKALHLRRAPLPQDVEKLAAAGAGELASKLERGVPAIALTSNSAVITAITNDTGAEMMFAQQVYVYGRPGDVLIGISTSGKALNVKNALKVAKAMGLRTIGFTGEHRSDMDRLCDILLRIPAGETDEVQELLLPVLHAICSLVEMKLF